MTRAASILLSLLAFVAVTVDAGTAQELPSGTVVVANMSAGTTWLVDVETGDRKALVTAQEAPHEVAISSDGRKAAVTNYGSGEGNLVQFIDVAAGRIVDEIVVEGYQRLHGAAFLPGDSLIVLTSERTGEVLVVGVGDAQIRRKLPTLGAASHMLAMGGDWIYTANIVDGTVSRIDPAGVEETLTWDAGTRTEGIAATPDGSQGWTGSMDAGTVVGIDGETGEEVVRVEGLAVPYRLAVTPDGETVVVTDPGAGVLGVIERATGALQRIDIGAAARAVGLAGDPSPQGFTLDPSGRWAFVSTKGLNRIAIVDLELGDVATFLESGAGPDGIGFTPVKAGSTPIP